MPPHAAKLVWSAFLAVSEMAGPSKSEEGERVTMTIGENRAEE